MRLQYSLSNIAEKKGKEFSLDQRNFYEISPEEARGALKNIFELLKNSTITIPHFEEKKK